MVYFNVGFEYVVGGHLKRFQGVGVSPARSGQLLLTCPTSVKHCKPNRHLLTKNPFQMQFGVRVPFDTVTRILKVLYDEINTV